MVVVDISKVGKQKNENDIVIKWTTLSMHVFCTGAEGEGVMLGHAMKKTTPNVKTVAHLWCWCSHFLFYLIPFKI